MAQIPGVFQKRFPCVQVPEIDLIKAVLYLNVKQSSVEPLRRGTCRIPQAEIPWSGIQSLCILGKEDKRMNEGLKSAELSSGAYVNRTGSFLLLVHPQTDDLLKALQLCRRSLCKLRILYSDIFSLPGLEHLTQLTHLDLSWCRNLTALPSLDNLTQLTELDLFWCSSLTVLPSLDNLTQLTDLSLSECSSLTALPSLDNLKQLTQLDLRGCGSLTALPSLDNLTQLTQLILWDCRSLIALPSLDNLKQLTQLDLSECGSLTDLPSLDNLTQLTQLNLRGCGSLTDLRSLDNLTQLTQLNLSACGSLTDLPSLDNLTQLTQLNLSWCRSLTVLPESLRNLKSLRQLNLNFLNLKKFPDWLPEIAEKFTLAYSFYDGNEKAIVSLEGTTVEGVDMSIFEQPYEIVMEWFEKRKQGQTHPLNEIKVVFLGDGEAGKSHTIARLLNDGGEPNPQTFDGESTPGIVISNKEYDLDGRKIQVHYWDFGGQEIMHSMHRIFLTGRTMYVVLLNARDDTQGDRAKYWLHNVKSFAPDAPVLLVLNKIDQNENASVDEVDLRGRYEKLTKIVRLSALKYSQEEFTAKFTDVLLEEIQKTGYLDTQWPTVWTRVKEKLENMETHYIMGSDYRAICQECMVDDNQKNLLHWFNDLGVSFCCDGEDDYALEDYVILRPDWITNALYIILFNKLEGARNGLIPHRTIYNLLRNAHGNPAIRCTLPQARYSLGDIGYVLGVMRKFNLSFPHGTDHEFIPMLCQQNSTVDVQYYHRDENTLEFNMEFDYLPNNLLHRLMVERHSELDMDNVWRTGARFELPELGLSAVVVIDSNTLRFFIRNTDPMHKSNTYLAMLKANVDRIVKAMGLKAPECKLVYKIHGTRAVFSYDRLLKMHARGRKEEYCEDLDEDFLIEDILNQSAPESLEGEQKLLGAIHKSCLNIQGDMRYRGSEEDDRNTRIRDDLRYIGYVVHDQTRQGTTESGKRAGELDLEIRRENGLPWTIVESLRISNGAKANWNKHLDKLVDSYNAHGLRTLFLIAFADCDKDRFKNIWKGYKDDHIQGHDSGRFTFVENSFREIGDKSANHLKVATCDYDCGGNRYHVYHIFVQMDPKPEAE